MFFFQTVVNHKNAQTNIVSMFQTGFSWPLITIYYLYWVAHASAQE